MHAQKAAHSVHLLAYCIFCLFSNLFCFLAEAHGPPAWQFVAEKCKTDLAAVLTSVTDSKQFALARQV